jgi:phytol kinase
MNIEWTRAFLFLSIFLALVATAHLLYKIAGLTTETSRKFLHVSGGILSMFAVLFFRSHWTVLFLCIAAFVFLLFTYVKNLLPAVHETKRRSFGSILFPIPVYICFLCASILHSDLYFLLPISFLTLSDTMAEWSGKKWGNRTTSFFNGQKTLAGATGFFITSLLLASAWIFLYKIGLNYGWILILTCSLFSTLAELVSTKGWDNLTVPLTALACIYYTAVLTYIF